MHIYYSQIFIKGIYLIFLWVLCSDIMDTYDARIRYRIRHIFDTFILEITGHDIWILKNGYN